jgi:hypothetical protein
LNGRGGIEADFSQNAQNRVGKTELFEGGGEGGQGDVRIEEVRHRCLVVQLFDNPMNVKANTELFQVSKC